MLKFYYVDPPLDAVDQCIEKLRNLLHHLIIAKGGSHFILRNNITKGCYFIILFRYL